MACETSRNKKSGSHQRRETQTLKNDQKEKRSDTEKKGKNQFGDRATSAHGLPRRP
jgi:hypothetical protein